MKLKLFLTISAIFLINSIYAQSARYILSGIVKDQLSGETLPFANVFLTGTTYGTTTDKNGEFSLKVFEPGSYELIIRFVGFDTYVQPVTFLAPEEKVYEVLLNPESLNLGSVEVTDQLDEEWQRNLATFKMEFLGRTKNATRCKILNEEEINFYYNKKTGVLQAFSDRPIRIENKALGYDLDYYLESFVVDYRKGLVSYYGFTQFKDSKKKNATKNRFIKSREKAYAGSREHFFKSLYNNKLKEQGFEVMLAKDVKGLGRVVTAKDVNLSDSLVQGPTSISKSLSFKDFVYVTYTKEMESKEYALQSGGVLQEPVKNQDTQRSWIKLFSEEPISFEKSGYVINPISFLSNGYWGFEKVAEMLPTNYESIAY